MPDRRLHLILCSDAAGHEAMRQRRNRGFLPSVVDGGNQVASVPADNSWIDMLDVFDLGVVVCQASYLAWLGAGLMVLHAQAGVPDSGS
ncbi:hypothetical protein [Bradyrhizobium acaciae]|uniref:hypothetical protein n=1 Tax=Bradyrhizobium acaciae TaxID=2683706 RepID=UPI001E4CC465|nr:hypothetical protein [Bradyrhizobium acaciae]MCC8983967.1 hypothetical protein [Bradyrhizobium acaciae]